MSRQVGRVGVFIYGSCVSRDTFEYLDADRYRLVSYVARQSLISTFAGSRDPAYPLELLGSPFQRRMASWDALGAAVTVLRRHLADTEILLWDLFDERLGVHVHGDGVVTRSVEMVSVETAHGPLSAGRHVAFGTAEHLELFADSADRFGRRLQEVGLGGRVILLAPPWATVSDHDGATPPSFGLEAVDANAALAPYLSIARERVTTRIVTLPPAQVRGASAHRWGPAPFHYSAETYAALARGIEAEIDAITEGGER